MKRLLTSIIIMAAAVSAAEAKDIKGTVKDTDGKAIA